MADEPTLDLILREARSHGKFHDRPVDPALLRAAHEIMKWGPTTANSQFSAAAPGSRAMSPPKWKSGGGGEEPSALRTCTDEVTLKSPLTRLNSPGPLSAWNHTQFWVGVMCS